MVRGQASGGGRSHAQATRERAQLVRSIEKDLRVTHRKTIAALRAKVKELRAQRARDLAAAHATCRAQGIAVRERADEDYKKAVEVARDRRRACRQKARETCGAQVGAIRQRAAAGIAAVIAERLQREADRRDISRSEKYGRGGKKTTTTRAERRQESDEEVLRDIPETHVPLWEQVKRSIKGGARWTRSEQFMHFVHDHPEAVTEAIEHEVAREMVKLQQDYARQAKDHVRAPEKPTRKGKPSAPRRASGGRRAPQDEEPDESPIRVGEVIVDSDFDVAALELAGAA